MNVDEERQYLCDLIMSASEWRLSEGDERDTLRLEIQDRLRRLNGVETEDENGYIQSDPVEVSPVLTEDDYKDLEASKLNEHLASTDKTEKKWQKQWKWKMDKIRVIIDGKITWKPKAECTQEPRDNTNGGPKWHWVWHDPDQEKKAQEEQMWQEHEVSNG